MIAGRTDLPREASGRDAGQDAAVVQTVDVRQGTHYVGLDLAWGEKQPTGVAVLDAQARLLQVAAVRTDEAILELLEPYAGGPVLVAVDAPLIVTNPTGSRPAEKALAKDFRRFEAAPHPSNTGKPEFAGGSRGARVCAALGLDLDPRSRRDRRAIEVYPHPATVVLFDLPRTLKYKNKPGRTLESLRSELLRLMVHVESVVTVDSTWAALRATVSGATTKAQLRVVEDQVDAVLCAYIGWFADHRPERTTVYGDLAEGYIVTPSPVGEPVSASVVRSAVEQYTLVRPELEVACRQAVSLVTGILDDAGINYLTVAGRTKSVSSFAVKAGRTADGGLVFADPLRDILDQIGLRVITYVRSDVDAVAGLLGDQVVVHDDRDMGEQTASEGRFGYASRHLLIGLDPARQGQDEFSALAGRSVQVQIRTVLQHAWAEFEHDIRYKGNVPDEHRSEFDRRFTLAAGLLELADQEFSAIRDKLRSPTDTDDDDDDTDDDPRIASRELAAFLAGQYADAGWSRTDHYTWISGLLLELGIGSLGELAEVLRRTDEAAIADKMAYRYPPGAVRRLDDALLAAYGQDYVNLHGNEHRRPALTQRWSRLLAPPV